MNQEQNHPYNIEKGNYYLFVAQWGKQDKYCCHHPCFKDVATASTAREARLLQQEVSRSEVLPTVLRWYSAIFFPALLFLQEASCQSSYLSFVDHLLCSLPASQINSLVLFVFMIPDLGIDFSIYSLGIHHNSWICKSLQKICCKWYQRDVNDKEEM